MFSDYPRYKEWQDPFKDNKQHSIHRHRIDHFRIAILRLPQNDRGEKEGVDRNEERSSWEGSDRR